MYTLLKYTGPTLITDNIVLGGRDDSQNSDLLFDFGISHVLNVAQQLPNMFTCHFQYEKLDLLDNEECDIRSAMPRAVEFIRNIENSNGRVLIHCISGVSRSVTVLVMYLMMEHRLPLKESYDYIKKCRPFIGPNESFKLQMARCEVELFGYSSVAGPSATQDWNFYAWNREKQKHKHADVMKSSTCAVM